MSVQTTQNLTSMQQALSVLVMIATNSGIYFPVKAKVKRPSNLEIVSL